MGKRYKCKVRGKGSELGQGDRNMLETRGNMKRNMRRKIERLHPSRTTSDDLSMTSR